MFQRVAAAMFAGLLAFVLGACGGGVTDAGEPASGTPDASDTAAATVQGGTPAPPADAEATVDATPSRGAVSTVAGTSTPGAAQELMPAAVPVSPPLVRYIGGTGGSGVSLRTGCSVDARAPGAWADGTEVLVEQAGRGDCYGWSVARSGGVTSWVSNGYLVTTRRIVSTATATATATPAPAATPRSLSLSGTVWAVYADWMASVPGNYPTFYTFLGNGSLSMASSDGTPMDLGTPLTSWEQSGESVSWSINNFYFYSGAITAGGSRMYGTARNGIGQTSPWYAIKRE